MNRPMRRIAVLNLRIGADKLTCMLKNDFAQYAVQAVAAPSQNTKSTKGCNVEVIDSDRLKPNAGLS